MDTQLQAARAYADGLIARRENVEACRREVFDMTLLAREMGSRGVVALELIASLAATLAQIDTQLERML